MTLPRFPFALDPLMAEAKRRMRKRRLIGLALLLVAAIGLGVMFAVRSPGGQIPSGSLHRGAAQSTQHLAHIVVPIDKTERQWRNWIRSQAPALGAVPRSRGLEVRRVVRARVTASGATLLRLKVWRATGTAPPVELVVATATPQAVYLKHHLSQLLSGINSHYWFIEVVNRHGAKFFESATRSTGGTGYVTPGLQECVATMIIGSGGPPCPAP